MGAQAPEEGLTALLARWRTGSPDDREKVLAAVQADLRRIAGAYMRRERPEHTLQPTALVNEAYLRLVGSREEGRWEDRAHFFGIAARLMRQILVDHARKRRARKRGMGARSDRSVSKLADLSSARISTSSRCTRRSTSWPSSIPGKRRSSSCATSVA